MSPEQAAAFVIAQAAWLNATIAGMQADNAINMACNRLPLYRREDFEKVAAESGCGHNDVLGLFQSTNR